MRPRYMFKCFYKVLQHIWGTMFHLSLWFYGIYWTILIYHKHILSSSELNSQPTNTENLELMQKHCWSFTYFFRDIVVSSSSSCSSSSCVLHAAPSELRSPDASFMLWQVEFEQMRSYFQCAEWCDLCLEFRSLEFTWSEFSELCVGYIVPVFVCVKAVSRPRVFPSCVVRAGELLHLLIPNKLRNSPQKSNPDIKYRS